MKLNKKKEEVLNKTFHSERLTRNADIKSQTDLPLITVTDRITKSLQDEKFQKKIEKNTQ